MPTTLLKPAGDSQPVEVLLERIGQGSSPRYAIRCGRFQAEVEVEHVGAGRGWLRAGGKIYPFAAAVGKKSTIQIWVRGRVYACETATAVRNRAAETASASASGALTAGMPGTILKVNVSPGDSFQAHQPLIIMESMKMEMTLSMPYDGQVDEITCRVGQLVEMGAILARLQKRE